MCVAGVFVSPPPILSFLFFFPFFLSHPPYFEKPQFCNGTSPWPPRLLPVPPSTQASKHKRGEQEVSIKIWAPTSSIMLSQQGSQHPDWSIPFCRQHRGQSPRTKAFIRGPFFPFSFFAWLLGKSWLRGGFCGGVQKGCPHCT